MSVGIEIEQINIDYAKKTPLEILEWSWKIFNPTIIASSSFQSQSVVLLHMIVQVCPEMKVIFLDTGYHFPETLTFRDQLQELLGINVKTVYPDPEARKHLEDDIKPPFRRDPDLCCRINKVEPMKRALSSMQAWVTGIRRDQTTNRKETEIIEMQRDGLYKINPLASWTKKEIWTYINDHKLPTHPLFSEGYPSIGCAPCTRRIFGDEDERDGRWAGTDKDECGIHTPAINIKEVDVNLNSR